jgi:hypothetical protein
MITGQRQQGQINRFQSGCCDPQTRESGYSDPECFLKGVKVGKLEVTTHRFQEGVARIIEEDTRYFFWSINDSDFWVATQSLSKDSAYGLRFRGLIREQLARLITSTKGKSKY